MAQGGPAVTDDVPFHDAHNTFDNAIHSLIGMR